MYRPIKFIAIALVGALAACSDGTVAPRTPAAAPSITGGGANAALSGSDTTRFNFVINPSHTTSYALGAGNSIVFPAGSLCDLSSTYGPDQWDAPCVVASNAVVVNAKAWLDAAGHPRIDFDKHLRFVPSADPGKWVIMTFTDWSASIGFNSAIGYCATPTSTCVNEAATDPSLLTVRNPATGQLTRRLKHFSGYNVFSGRDCDPNTDPSCGGDSESSMNRIGTPGSVSAPDAASFGRGSGANGGKRRPKDSRSGYMLGWS